jgi:hypothetical protein
VIHLGDDDLVLLHYSESEDTSGAGAHLRECSECRARRDALTLVLAASGELAVPERPADYGQQVWERLAPRLARPTARPVFVPRRFAAFAALAASLAIAFVLGRRTAPQLPLSQPVRERILLVAVGDHLERSQMVLLELTNADPKRPLEIASERRLARELVGANRLYRQSAVRAGEAGVADLLDELERVLVEVAHAPDALPPAQVQALQQRIAARGIVFKTRVLGMRAREREKSPVAASPAAIS